MNKNYNLKLDLQFRCNNSVMKFNQFDNNTSDFFMKISNGGKSFDIEKAIVVLAVIKPSGKVASQFVEVKNDIIYADLKSSMKDEIGTYTAKAMLILKDERVVTDAISYEVEEDKIFSLLNDTVETAEDFTLLTDMLSRLSTIEITEEQRIVNEAERILAEENRKIEEAKRVEAELIRQHEEADRAKYDATRESNENIRKQNESIRLANETNRIDEEAKRVEEENKRKLAEEERNANYNFMTEDEERRRSEANAHKEAEVLRVQAETDRVNEEAKRRTTEQARVSAENTRVSNENTREANEVVRKNNENQRVEAETQRQSRYNSFISDAEKVANDFEAYTNSAKASEEERKTNELDRKSQEDRRVSNENERVSNENIRKISENARIESEKQRVDAENLRKEKIIEIQSDYDSLKKVIIDENASANLQNQINQTNSQLEHIANKGTTVEVLERVTKEEIDRQIQDGTIANLTIKDSSIDGDKIKEDSIKFKHCDFLEGFVDYENLHKEYTLGVGQGAGKVVVGGSVNVSSIFPVIPNMSYNFKVDGEHDRFRICGLNTLDGKVSTTTPYLKTYTSDDKLSEFTIDNIGDINTLVVSVSASNQTPFLEVYINEKSDVDFKFPVKADIVKDGAIIDGSGIKEGSIKNASLKDVSIEPTKTTFLTEGKNKYKGEIIRGYAIIANRNGEISNQNDENFIIAYATIKSNTQYTVSYPHTSQKFRICELNDKYDFNTTYPPNSADKLVISDDNLKEYTFTTSENAKMLLVYMSDKGVIHDLQIEENEVKTDYRPYGFKLFNRYIEDITDINMVEKMFKNFIVDKDNALNKFYECTTIERDENISKKQCAEIYELYDSLMNNNNKYISKEVLGNTTFDNIPINCYKFTPPSLKITNFISTEGRFENTDEKINVQRKRIICLSGVHGDERSTVIGLYTFLKDVCDNPENNILLEKIKREIEFIIVPIVNPTGYNACSRFAKNQLGNLVVDINREFKDSLLTSESYNGLSNEAKVIADLIKANKEVLTLVVDLHNMQPQVGENLSWWIMDGEILKSKANKAIVKTSRKWQEKYNFLEQDKDFLFGSTSTSDMIYPDAPAFTIQRFAHSLGLDALTLEFATAIKYNNFVSYSKEQLNLHLSLIGNLLSEYVD